MNNKKLSVRIIASCIVAVVAIVLSIGVGSVYVPAMDILSIIWHKIVGTPVPDKIDPSLVSILWEIRMPRALTAFIVGAALSVSGAIMQAILQNPLASSYTMGVSAGASLGAAIVIITGVTSSVLGFFLSQDLRLVF